MKFLLIVYGLIASYKWFTAYVATRVMSRIINENDVIPDDIESYRLCIEELINTLRFN